MLKVLFWETTDSKPKPRSTGMTHVAKHLDRILAEDRSPKTFHEFLYCNQLCNRMTQTWFFHSKTFESKIMTSGSHFFLICQVSDGACRLGLRPEVPCTFPGTQQVLSKWE